MPQIFPRSANRAPFLAAALLSLVGLAGFGFFWYYGSPEYTDVGYRPKQPVAYSHKQHVGDLGIDCRYCHSTVETAAHANIPPTQTCMNCHKLVKKDSDKLALVRHSWESGTPIPWVRVHAMPDYAYFNHAAHVRAGVGCVSCHGRVDQMEVVSQVKPLSMAWCLECHRNPTASIRPPSVKITDMTWQPGADQAAVAAQMTADRKLKPSQDCSVCHR